MLKKILLSMVAITMVLSLAACTPKSPEPSVGTNPDPTPTGPAFKIGIMTGTVAQNEEDYRMAERMQAKYGKDMILHQTYPTNFTQEQETIITNMMSMASDPDVKALILVQAVAGSVAAIDKVREIRPDMLIIMGSPGEDPDLVATKGDIILQVNTPAMGPLIIEQAHAMGAKKFIHFSFPRHMSMAMIASRHALMKEKARELGIEFIDVDAPDPMGEGGIPGTQLFIMEDVPRQIATHGKDTAFFGTNCAMMEQLITQVFNGGALMPIQCCPSPYHGMPAAFQITIPEDKKGDLEYILAQIKDKLTQKGMEQRISTWPAPINMMFIEAGVEYSKLYLEGKTNGRVDEVKLKEAFKGLVTFKNYNNNDHYFMVLAEFVDFSK